MERELKQVYRRARLGVAIFWGKPDLAERTAEELGLDKTEARKEALLAAASLADIKGNQQRAWELTTEALNLSSHSELSK